MQFIDSCYLFIDIGKWIIDIDKWRLNTKRVRHIHRFQFQGRAAQLPVAMTKLQGNGHHLYSICSCMTDPNAVLLSEMILSSMFDDYHVTVQLITWRTAESCYISLWWNTDITRINQYLARDSYIIRLVGLLHKTMTIGFNAINHETDAWHGRTVNSNTAMRMKQPTGWVQSITARCVASSIEVASARSQCSINHVRLTLAASSRLGASN